MSNQERIDQIKRQARNPKEAIGMILSACIDKANAHNAWVSDSEFDKVADLFMGYFDIAPQQPQAPEALVGSKEESTPITPDALEVSGWQGCFDGSLEPKQYIKHINEPNGYEMWVNFRDPVPSVWISVYIGEFQRSNCKAVGVKNIGQLNALFALLSGEFTEITMKPPQVANSLRVEERLPKDSEYCQLYSHKSGWVDACYIRNEFKPLESDGYSLDTDKELRQTYLWRPLSPGVSALKHQLKEAHQELQRIREAKKQ